MVPRMRRYHGARSRELARRMSRPTRIPRASNSFPAFAFRAKMVFMPSPSNGSRSFDLLLGKDKSRWCDHEDRTEQTPGSSRRRHEPMARRSRGVGAANGTSPDAGGNQA